MKRMTGLLAALTMIALVAVPAQLALAQGTEPDPLQPRAGQDVVWRSKASGVQIYRCDDAGAAWTFVEPAAELARGAIHYGENGPNWQSVEDGSLVRGQAIATRPNDEGDIPDLLVEAVENRGDGVLGGVDFIQRLRSRGGVAPAGPCTPGAEQGVPYTARYVFWSDGQ